MKSLQIVPFNINPAFAQKEERAMIDWIMGRRPDPNVPVSGFIDFPPPLSTEEIKLWHVFFNGPVFYCFPNTQGAGPCFRKLIGRLPREVAEQYVKAYQSRVLALEIRQRRDPREFALFALGDQHRYLLARWNAKRAPLLTLHEIKYLCLAKLGPEEILPVLRPKTIMWTVALWAACITIALVLGDPVQKPVLFFGGIGGLILLFPYVGLLTNRFNRVRARHLIRAIET